MNQLKLAFEWNLKGIYNDEERKTVEAFLRKACSLLCEKMGYTPKRTICYELCDDYDTLIERSIELVGDDAESFQNANFILPISEAASIEEIIHEARTTMAFFNSTPEAYLYRIRNRSECDRDAIKTLRIVAEIRDDFLPGVDRCNMEWETHKNIYTLPEKGLEARALKLFKMMSNLEAMLHAFVHTCNFEREMDTLGVNKAMVETTVEYDLQAWDDYLAKYWSLRALYSLIPNFEVNMFLSNYLQQLAGLDEAMDNVNRMMDLQKENYRQRGLEKMMEREAAYLPKGLRYLLETPFSSRDGTQQAGFIQANYEYLLEKADEETLGRKNMEQLQKYRLRENEQDIVSLLELDRPDSERRKDYAFHHSRAFKCSREAVKYIQKLAPMVLD